MSSRSCSRSETESKLRKVALLGSTFDGSEGEGGLVTFSVLRMAGIDGPTA